MSGIQSKIIRNEQKKPSQDWSSHACCQVPEKAQPGLVLLCLPLGTRKGPHQDCISCTRGRWLPCSSGTRGAPTIQVVVLPPCPALTGADPSAPGQPQDYIPVVGPYAEVGIKPKLNPRNGTTKEEDQKSFHQLHKLHFKSLQ